MTAHTPCSFCRSAPGVHAIQLGPISGLACACCVDESALVLARWSRKKLARLEGEREAARRARLDVIRVAAEGLPRKARAA